LAATATFTFTPAADIAERNRSASESAFGPGQSASRITSPAAPTVPIASQPACSSATARAAAGLSVSSRSTAAVAQARTTSRATVPQTRSVIGAVNPSVAMRDSDRIA